MNKTQAGKYHYHFNNVLSSNDKKNALNNLKKKADFRTLSSVSEGVIKVIPQLGKYIYGNSFPEEPKNLYEFNKLYFPQVVLEELNWVMLSIKKKKNDICHFVSKKENFENFFLLGKYKECGSILEEIKNKYGYSYWYIESKFLLLEYEDKSEEQKVFLSELNEASNKEMVGIMSHFLSQRTERNLSAYKYDYDIINLFKRDKEDFFQNLARSYYKFTLNFFEHVKIENVPYIILHLNYIPLFDRYLALINLLKSLFISKVDLTSVLEKCVYIYRKTKDKSLLQLIITFIPDFTFDEDFVDDLYIKIIDEYYKGNYDNVVKDAKIYSLENPSNLEVLKMYAKSLIANNKEYDPIFPPNSVANNISNSIYNILASKPDSIFRIDKLYTIHKNLLSFSLSGELNSFVKNEQNEHVDENVRVLFSNRLNPFLYRIHPVDELSKLYLLRLRELFPLSTCIKHLFNVSQDKIDDESEVCEEIRSIDNCSIFFKTNQYQKCKDIANEVIKRFKDNPPVLQKGLKFLFDSHVVLNEFNEAIELYVDQYICNPNNVNKIKTHSLLKKLRTLRYKGIRRTISLPIFVSLTSSEDAEKGFILESFIQIHNSELPSELLNQKIGKSLELEELFYSNCCSSDILKHYIYLNDTLSVLSERQKILNHLILNYENESKVYTQQLDHILNEIIIYEGTRKLDESKIYANDQAIINYELSEIEGLFSRFKTIYKLVNKNKRIVLLEKYVFSFITFDPNEEDKMSDVKYTDTALLEVFSEIFDLILEKYLFSKFGIVAYLSTRIRHGVLGGEIRPEIDKHNLILNRKGNTSEYHDTKYWSKPYYGLDLFETKKLNEILTKFSLRIDNNIESILKEKIQIKKNGKNLEGLFNYEFSKQELNALAHSLGEENDVKVFCQKIIDKIWERTDFNLEIIRDYFNTEAVNMFSSAFSDLETDVDQSFGNKINSIKTNSIECANIIELRLKRIGDWFKRTGSTLEDFDIENLFGIIWSNTEKCYKGEAQLNVNFNKRFPLIKSKYYIHFTDLFRIFVDNMFKYGKIQNGIKNFQIQVNEVGSHFVCVLENIISDDYKEDLEYGDRQSSFQKEKLFSERKSGISKAVKIVQYDLNDITNKVHVNIYRDDQKNEDMFKVTLSINLKDLVIDV